MSETAPIRRRRKPISREEFLDQIAIPFHEGIRIMTNGKYPPGTLFLSRREYFELKKLEKEGKYQTSELDAVAAEVIKAREKRKALAEASSQPVAQPKKLIPLLSPKEQRSRIKALAKDNSNDLLERFFDKMIPEEVRESLSEEQLEIRKKELLAEFAEMIKNRLHWALREMYLESQGRLDSF